MSYQVSMSFFRKGIVQSLQQLIELVLYNHKNDHREKEKYIQLKLVQMEYMVLFHAALLLETVEHEIEVFVHPPVEWHLLLIISLVEIIFLLIKGDALKILRNLFN